MQASRASPLNDPDGAVVSRAVLREVRRVREWGGRDFPAIQVLLEAAYQVAARTLRLLHRLVLR